jgi:hypothetical protein
VPLLFAIAVIFSVVGVESEIFLSVVISPFPGFKVLSTSEYVSPC